MEQEFELKGEYIELVKLLKVTGLCQTGGEAKMVTSDGLVKVDGEVETRKKKKIRHNQLVEFEGNTIKVIWTGDVLPFLMKWLRLEGK